jgi:4-hydroxy-tetrahydrodipicolinate synthase
MPLPYAKAEARAWAREHLHGVYNVLTPTFTSDLAGLNADAVRHDVRLEIEYGFEGALLVSETATTLDEYEQFAEWAADEAQGRLRLIHHASFNTLEENLEAAQRAARAGAELALLAYPPTFYPRSEEELYGYTAAFCRGVDLAVILFPVPLWGFERIHPAAGFGPDLLERLVDDVPNIVAIKAEGGMPWIGGFVHAYQRVGDRVLVTEPLEGNGIPMASCPACSPLRAAEIPRLRWNSIGASIQAARPTSRRWRCCREATFCTACCGNTKVGCRVSTGGRCGRRPCGSPTAR